MNTIDPSLLPEPGYFTSTRSLTLGKIFMFAGAVIAGSCALAGGFTGVSHSDFNTASYLGGSGLFLFVSGAIIAIKAYRERSTKREAWLACAQDPLLAAELQMMLLRSDTEDFLDARDALTLASKAKNWTAVKALVNSNKCDVHHVLTLAMTTKNLPLIHYLQRSSRFDSNEICIEARKNKVMRSAKNWNKAYQLATKGKVAGLARCRQKPLESVYRAEYERRIHNLQGDAQATKEAASQMCHSLQNDYYVQRHAQGSGIACITDLITQTEVHSVNRAAHLTLKKPHARFRIAGKATTFAHLQDCTEQNINDNTLYWRINLLSTDANENNWQPAESANYFYTRGINMLEGRDYYNGIVTSLVQHGRFQSLFTTSLASIGATRYRDPKRLSLIAIPKAHVIDSAQCYIYRSHPYGYPDRQGDHATFLQILDRHQQGRDTSGYGYQYRILLGNLDADPDTMVCRFDNFTPTERADYSAKMHDLSMWVRAIKRLEALDNDSTEQQVIEALSRIPLFVKNGKTQTYIHGQSSFAIDDAIAGLKEIFRDKQAILTRYSAQITTLKPTLAPELGACL